MLPVKEVFLLFIGSLLFHFTNATNTKHMYALCPPDFVGIGTECYYISQKKENWLDAHFDCKDRKSRLAEPNKYEDRMVRRFLVNNDLSKESKWIGGNYNWAQKKWQWQDGKEFVYQSFSQTPGGVQELQYHCAILNPNLKYRWSASSCVEKHQYICQHRMPYLNEKHRSRIFSRWNQTYPNAQATQVEVVINEAEMLKRGNRQSIPVNGRSTNTQRLSRHRNYLASEWLKKYRSHQLVLNRNTITNDISLINTKPRKIPQRPNRLAPRRRNPGIGRDDFIQFERNKNVHRGPLITNKVDDFDTHEPNTVPPTAPPRYYDQTTRQRNREEDITSPPRHYEQNRDEDVTSPPRHYEQNRDEDVTSPPRHYEQNRDRDVTSQPRFYQPNRIEDVTSSPRNYQPNRFEDVTSSPRHYKKNSENDLREKKRLEDTRRLLETGRYENAYTRSRTGTTLTTTTTTEANVEDVDNEIVDSERDRDFEHRRQQEEEEQERLRDEEIRRNEERRRIELRRREDEERRRMEEERHDEERRMEEDRLQNQINEETLRTEHEEQLRVARIEQEEQRRAEERKRIYEENLRDREEKMRLRELELKDREEEERKLREAEQKRQDENRERLEEIERQRQEAEEKNRQDAENKRIEEENRRRRKEELRNKQKQRQQVESSDEDEFLNDVRLKEKLRREKIAKLKERISKLSPEDQLKFFELRGKRNKKHSNGGNENET